MFERFAREARNAVVVAVEEAQALAHPKVGTEHLLLALFSDPGPTGDLLREVPPGLDADGVRQAVSARVAQSRPLLDDRDVEALAGIGIDARQVLARIEATFGPEATVVPAPSPKRRLAALLRTGERRTVGTGHRPFSPRAKKVLELSLREALRLKAREISVAHLLLGLLREGDGLACLVLTDLGVDLVVLRRAAEPLARGRAA